MLRKKKSPSATPNLGLVKAAIGPAQRFRRHVPPLLFLLALIGVLIAVARPSAIVTLPSDARTIIMAMDVSLSMRATDVDPNRIVAAQNAAKQFVQELPQDIRAGIVTFAGTALLVQPPTQEPRRPDRRHRPLPAAAAHRDRQRHHRLAGHAVSRRRHRSRAASCSATTSARATASRRTDPDKAGASRKKKEVKPVPPGSYTSAAIILLTDGRRTTGPDPMDAARMAANHGVRVFTVGFGSAGGGSVDIDGMSIYMRFDEETLKGIAGITQAEYFHAASAAADLKKIYEGLNTKFALERKETEITALFAAAAALLAVASATFRCSGSTGSFRPDRVDIAQG